MSKRPYYKRFPADFLHSCMKLSLEEKGAFSVVLDLIYDTAGPIENDPQWIARVCGCSTRRWNQLLAILIGKRKLYLTDDGKITNSRAQDQLEKFEIEARTFAENGKKGGEKSGEIRREASQFNGLGEKGLRETERENQSSPYPYPYLDQEQYRRDLEVQTRVASLNVVQKPDINTITVANDSPITAPQITAPPITASPTEAPSITASPITAEQTEAPQDQIDPRRLMPRAKDPPYIWIGSGLSRGSDGRPRTVLQETTPRLVAGVAPNRCLVDHAAREICRVALIDPSWRGDWNVLVDWLDEGLELATHILPAIEELVARRLHSGKPYRQPSTLRYFSAAIREYAARCRAA